MLVTGGTHSSFLMETCLTYIRCLLLPCREQQEPTIDDALEGLEDLDPEDAAIPQQASMGRSGGLQAVQPTPAKPLLVTAVGMQDMEDFHLKVCTLV